jgi:SHS2 domain-containing protein
MWNALEQRSGDNRRRRRGGNNQEEQQPSVEGGAVILSSSSSVEEGCVTLSSSSSDDHHSLSDNKRLKTEVEVEEEGKSLPPSSSTSNPQQQNQRSRVCASIIAQIDSNIAERSGMGKVSRDAIIDGEVEKIDAMMMSSSSSSLSTSSCATTSRPTGISKVDVLPFGKYEYLDHTADVQLHSWGCDLGEALEWLGVSMFGYMTDLETIDVDDDGDGDDDTHSDTHNTTHHSHTTPVLVAEGHDMESLLFAFLDEWLYAFNDTGFIAREIEVMSISRGSSSSSSSSSDDHKYTIKSRGRGEVFKLNKHPQGTEVKAITYSNMQIIEGCKEGGGEDTCHLYVIVDI